MTSVLLLGVVYVPVMVALAWARASLSIWSSAPIVRMSNQ
jgi:hypothetical protein